MNRKRGLKWLNFLYSFFGLEVLIKSWIAIGTLSTIVQSTKGEEPEPLFTMANVLTMMVVIFFLTEAAFKLIACIRNTKEDGYSTFVWALAIGTFANIFYVFEDQGFLTGLFFLLIFGGLFAINYSYVRKRKYVYGNPDAA